MCVFFRYLWREVCLPHQRRHARRSTQRASQTKPRWSDQTQHLACHEYSASHIHSLGCVVVVAGIGSERWEHTAPIAVHALLRYSGWIPHTAVIETPCWPRASGAHLSAECCPCGPVQRRAAAGDWRGRSVYLQQCLQCLQCLHGGRTGRAHPHYGADPAVTVLAWPGWSLQAHIRRPR